MSKSRRRDRAAKQNQVSPDEAQEATADIDSGSGPSEQDGLSEQEPSEEGPSSTSDSQVSTDEEQKPEAEQATASDQLLQEAIDSLREETAALQDQLLRKTADFENFRKRLNREKEEFVKYAISELLLDLTTLIDDFERAIKSAEESQEFASFLKGVALIEQQMVNMLEKRWNLKRFDSLGDEFDPNRHQAIATVESDEVDAPKVVEDYQRGYVLHDRILRPAKVKVAQPSTDKAASDDGDTEQAPSTDDQNHSN